jgi:DNA polymerase-4/DNA polymerase V
MEQPLSLRSFPRAILHIDADAFFASCEQAVNPKLKGKPVITGKERGIAAAVSYEAKALGVKRGMSIRDIKAVCPEVVYLPSDYETYSLFSQRMFAIVRRYTSEVEEYSIDECFCELTGLRRPLRMSYATMVARIKADLEGELGLTFSLGLAPTKVVAKIASKWHKPAGLTMISGKDLHRYLAKIAMHDVWGIGEQTTAYLARFGIVTALDFARKDERWVREKLTKPHVMIWHELRGISVIPLELGEKHTYQSISKTKTFTPPTSDRAVLLAQLSKNTENACIKARRYALEARRVFFLVRTQDYRHAGYDLVLSRPTNVPSAIVPLINQHLDTLYRPNILYRATGVVLSDLRGEGDRQLDLFGEALRAERTRQVYDAIDQLDAKYGKHTVFLGASFAAMQGKQHAGDRAELPRRRQMLLPGEGERKRLGIPLLGEV